MASVLKERLGIPSNVKDGYITERKDRDVSRLLDIPRDCLLCP